MKLQTVFYNNKKEKKKVVSKKSELVKILQYSPSLPFFLLKDRKKFFFKDKLCKVCSKKACEV